MVCAEVAGCECVDEGHDIVELDGVVVVVVGSERGGTEGEDLIRLQVGVGVECAVGPSDLDGFDY